MDDVLVLWDALFADGPMLDLVDYIYISMLKAIRKKRKLNLTKVFTVQNGDIIKEF